MFGGTVSPAGITGIIARFSRGDLGGRGGGTIGHGYDGTIDTQIVGELDRPDEGEIV